MSGKGGRTTVGDRSLADYVPAEDGVRGRAPAGRGRRPARQDQRPADADERADRQPDLRDAPPRAPRSLRIAFLPAFSGVPTPSDVRDACARVAAAVASEGARVEERNPGFTVDDEHLLAVASAIVGVIGGFRAPPSLG